MRASGTITRAAAPHLKTKKFCRCFTGGEQIRGYHAPRIDFFFYLLLPPWYSPGRPPLSLPFAKMKYVLVSGGVISGVGKGIIASSTGLLLKTAGLSVSSIKIDPYLNPDAGLMNVRTHLACDLRRC